ncbi:response regulator transcription factor [Algoriphagus kandeliae]|uniref:Response regulator transcription factor n=1 Tax=Algoriphagus kandeliae TaxID=2562278 RepID=A0A4Y9R235_9BACT|nr:LytTR family DNA-binding domain-containing protein [Algoriphagus kandeliae]TFV97663.1 response regulator transcription factor [Algoriphagus kandeliae]
MIQAIAIDDESFALEVIKSHAAKVPFLELQATFTNAIEGLEYLKEHSIPLLFLDINMPDISGIDLVQLLPKGTEVIFTTAYSDYAVKGFDLDAMDYLLKPFSFPRFLKACQKARDWFSSHAEEELWIFIKTNEGQVRIDFSDLIFCESKGNYVHFQTIDACHQTRMTLQEAEKLLPSYFIRTHRSFLANKNHIKVAEKHQLRLGKFTVPVSSSYADEVFEKINLD